MQQDKVLFSLRKGILEKLPENIRDKVAIAGGAVRDKLLDVEVKDYDLFIDSKETEDELIKFLNEKAKKGQINDLLANYTFEGKWLQVVRGKYFDLSGSALIDSFDLVHCCAMVTMNTFHTHPEFYRCIATKHIMVNKLEYPLSTLERLVKYIKKGYTPCNGTLLTLSKSINELDKEVFNLSADSTQDDAAQNRLTFYPDGSPRFLGVD